MKQDDLGLKKPIILRVNNLEHSLHFYTSLFGCSVKDRSNDTRMVYLTFGAQSIILIDIHGALGRRVGPMTGEQSCNLNRFSLKVEASEISRLIARLSSEWSPANNPSMKYADEVGGWSIYCFDPDGNQIDLVGNNRHA